MADLVDAIRVLRDEVLDTVLHGDRDPPGAEVFDAVLRMLAASGETISGDTIPDLDLALHDAVARRLAWGDGEEVVLADAEAVFDRLLVAALRALRDPADQMVVIETATLVAVTVSRVVALAATARAARERAARLREEMAQRQLQEALGEQQATIAQLEEELKRDY
ncbi:MAG TPA: hypothetical protein VK932_19595 [Kofleriaceae bacterium]|nr:hypothetical protein [Kofleriaceae bacterium]